MLHVASVCAPCCMLPELLHKVWNRLNFEPTTPNISFVPWSPKSSVTMLDLFAQLFQHCLAHADALHMVSFKFTKPYRPRLYPSHDALLVRLFRQITLHFHGVKYESWNPFSFIYLKPESGEELLHIGHYRVYPPPGMIDTNIAITLMAHEIWNV